MLYCYCDDRDLQCFPIRSCYSLVSCFCSGGVFDPNHGLYRSHKIASNETKMGRCDRIGVGRCLGFAVVVFLIQIMVQIDHTKLLRLSPKWIGVTG